MIARNLNIPEIKFMPFKNRTSRPPQIPRKTLPSAITNSLTQRNQTIDCLYRAQSILNLSRSTLYLGIALLDKLLTSGLDLKEKNVDLICGTILMVVTKFNEIYPVTIRKLNALSMNNSQHEKYIELEGQLLQMVNFDLSPEDPIYQELAQLEHKLGQKSHQLTKIAVMNPAVAFRLGSQPLLSVVEGIALGQKRNQNKLISEQNELKKDLLKLRGVSSDLRRMASPSRA